MADAVQSYKKHARLLPPFHFFVIPVLLVNLLNEMRHLYLDPSRHFVWQVIVAAALLMVGFLSRIQALTVQDRVIRLEMRLRLRGFCRPTCSRTSSTSRIVNWWRCASRATPRWRNWCAMCSPAS